MKGVSTTPVPRRVLQVELDLVHAVDVRDDHVSRPEFSTPNFELINWFVRIRENRITN